MTAGLALAGLLGGLLVAGLAVSTQPAAAEEPETAPPDVSKLKRLAPDYDVWLDVEGRRVVMTGRVVLREGQLEMFACLTGTKEHESILAVDTEAYIVHAALLASGAEAGGPVEFLPKYRPARGSEIEITLYWKEKDGRTRTARGQDWVRDVPADQAMTQPWVFGGSGFFVDDVTGKRYYLAEDGDFICLSNFTSAMLDVPVPSSQSNDALLFDAFTDRIPPKGTEVTMVLTPKAPLKPADE